MADHSTIPFIELDGPNWEAVRAATRGENPQMRPTEHWLISGQFCSAVWERSNPEDPFLRSLKELEKQRAELEKRHRAAPPSPSSGRPVRPTSAHAGSPRQPRPLRPTSAQPRLHHDRPAPPQHRPAPPPPRSAAAAASSSPRQVGKPSRGFAPPPSIFVLTPPTKLPEFYYSADGTPPRLPYATFQQPSQPLPKAQRLNVAAPPSIAAGAASIQSRPPPGASERLHNELQKVGGFLSVAASRRDLLAIHRATKDAAAASSIRRNWWTAAAPHAAGTAVVGASIASHLALRVGAGPQQQQQQGRRERPAGILDAAHGRAASDGGLAKEHRSERDGRCRGGDDLKCGRRLCGGRRL